MALNKLRQLDGNSYGVTLPKDDLQLEGLLDGAGELEGEHHVHVKCIDDREWTLELIKSLDFNVENDI